MQAHTDAFMALDSQGDGEISTKALMQHVQSNVDAAKPEKVPLSN